MTLTHFPAAVFLALAASIVFGITQRAHPRMMVRYGAFCFVLFIGGLIAASWLFYFIKH